MSAAPQPAGIGHGGRPDPHVVELSKLMLAHAPQDIAELCLAFEVEQRLP